MFSIKRISYLQVMIAVALVGACKPPEPTPSQYTNLGTEEAPLLPTAQAWHDASIVKGASEWKPFRKLSDGSTKTAGGKATGGANGKAAADAEDKPADAGGGSDAEKEIRTLVADFNAALAANELDKASEYLTDAQAQTSGDVFAAVHNLVEQLKLLQAATPPLAEKIDALAPLLSIADALKIELQIVRVVDAKTATGSLVGGAEAHFAIGEEDLWYIESPVLTLLEKERPRIEKTTKDIEEALAKGTPDEAIVTALGTSLDELRGAISAPQKHRPNPDDALKRDRKGAGCLMLQAHSLTEARLYLKITGCKKCGFSTAKPLKPGSYPIPSGSPGVVRLSGNCPSCGAARELDFALASSDAAPADGRPVAINLTDKPSKIIDAGQWLTLSQLFIQESRSETDRRRARLLNLQAGECLSEALKFYDDPDNDLPPASAFFCDSSRRRFHESPQSFSRDRLISEQRKLPVVFNDPSS